MIEKYEKILKGKICSLSLLSVKLLRFFFFVCKIRVRNCSFHELLVVYFFLLFGCGEAEESDCKVQEDP